MKAYAWRTGRIDFGCRVPSGALLIAAGSDDLLRRVINTMARHGWDGVLLVPGVAEAANPNEAVDALLRFVEVVAERMQRMDHGLTTAEAAHA